MQAKPAPLGSLRNNAAVDCRHRCRHVNRALATQRLSVHQALAHPWLKRATDERKMIDLSMALKSLRRYNATRKFRKGVLAVMMAGRVQRTAEYGLGGQARSTLHALSSTLR